jgi:hypothetical protein
MVVAMAGMGTRGGGRGVGLSSAELLDQLEFLSLILFEQRPELLNLCLLTHSVGDEAGWRRKLSVGRYVADTQPCCVERERAGKPARQGAMRDLSYVPSSASP